MQFDIVEIFRKMSGFQWVVVGTLLAMAVASSAVTLERLWVFWRSRRRSRAFAPVAARHLAAGEPHRLAGDAGEGKGGHLGRLLAAGVRTFLQASRRPGGAVSPGELARREMARQREAFDAELRRGMSVLASTGSVAPFVGLLGTVVGIIAAFEGIAKEGSGGLGAVSAGISEALVVTAFGLFVAIPTVLLFNFLSTRVERLMLDLDQAAGQLADHLEAGTAAPGRMADGDDTSLVDGAGTSASGETLATA